MPKASPARGGGSARRASASDPTARRPGVLCAWRAAPGLLQAGTRTPRTATRVGRRPAGRPMPRDGAHRCTSRWWRGQRRTWCRANAGWGPSQTPSHARHPGRSAARRRAHRQFNAADASSCDALGAISPAQHHRRGHLRRPRSKRAEAGDARRPQRASTRVPLPVPAPPRPPCPRP